MLAHVIDVVKLTIAIGLGVAISSHINMWIYLHP